MNKNKITFIVAGLLSVFFMAACNETKKSEVAKKEITVISREAGSGTRDAFAELVGTFVKENGKKRDVTTKEALTIDGTQGVLSTVFGNENAIGYISLGSLNETVKALKIEGVEATKGNVKSTAYPISRPFNIAVKGELKDVAKDFIEFIMSVDGQSIVDANGYVSVVNGSKYSAKNLRGKIVVAGSSSVSPIMEKLKEAYIRLNPNVEIEIQTTDSSSGMMAAKDGACDIGMASRELKVSESEILRSMTIARDGIAVIINRKNPVDNMTVATLRNIYTGNMRFWEQVE